VVGEVGERKKSSKLRGDEGDDDLLSVDLSDDTAHIGADVELGGSNGSRERLADGSDELGALSVNVGDADVDGLANKEDVSKVADKALASLRLGDKGAETTEQVDDTALVEELGDDGGGDLAGLDVGKRRGDREVAVDERLLESKDDTVTRGLDSKDTSLDGRADLEALLGVLEADVGVVEGPDDTVDGAQDVDEETLV
jgi:hypothetical protein